MEHSVSESLKYVLEPKIISCVAGAWKTGGSYCLPLDTAAEIITATGCRVVVVHIHRIQASIDGVSTPRNNGWRIDELVEKLPMPQKDTVLCVNTALCSNEKDVEDVVDVFKQLDQNNLFQRFQKHFLKLEILDKHNQVKDKDTIDIIRGLPEDIRHSCLPFLSGELACLKKAIEIGCPGIRIWCSDIGKGKGIVDEDEERLRNAVSVSTVPLVLEGGLATSGHVRQALELGFDAVLLNSAFRNSKDPVSLAREIRNVIDSADN